MTALHRYIEIPLDSVPKPPSSDVWFGTWTTSQPNVAWTQQRPEVPASGWLVAVSYDTAPEAAASGVIALGDGGKDLPPPMPLSVVGDVTAFRTEFAKQMGGRGGVKLEP